LRRPPSAMMAAMHGVDPKVARRHHCPVGINQANLNCATCTIKRIILIQVTPPPGQPGSGVHLFAAGATHTPVGFIDLDTSTGKIINAKAVGPGTAWKDVPTPQI